MSIPATSPLDRVTATVSTEDTVFALARMVSAIGSTAATSDDPADREWAADLLAAIIEFRAGDEQAFTDLAARNAARVGVIW